MEPLTDSSIYDFEPLLEPLMPPRWQPFTTGNDGGGGGGEVWLDDGTGGIDNPWDDLETWSE